MKEIAENVYQIPLFPRNSINAYIIDGYLIDAGTRGSGEKLLKAIDKYGRHKIKAHILTHAHADHQGASAFICETLQISLWCGEKDADAMENGRIMAEEYYAGDPIVGLGIKLWAGPKHKVSRTLKEGDWAGEFQILETPGHSPGHITLWREKDRTLIAGDVLVNMNMLTTATKLGEPPQIYTLDTEQNRNSILKLAQLQPNLVCVGHGAPLYQTEKLANLATSIKNDLARNKMAATVPNKI